jgi:GNAT superfamily N-acetyltransferase
MSSVKVVHVNSKRELQSFIDFPHELFRGDKNYVPELFVAQRDLLTPGKHPFHEHSQVQAFLAYRNEKIVGRIAAISNSNHNIFNKANDGFFGFFDCENNKDVAAHLFSEASEWLKNKGANTLIGPTNFSTNETCGLLVDGYDSPPTIMMTYNPSYYKELVEGFGFRKKTDLLAYAFGVEGYDDKPLRLINTLRERLKNRGVTIRKVSLKNFNEEATKIREVYNAAWDKNLGFVPMTNHEFDYLAKDMKMLLDPDFCLVAEYEGKFIGFALAIPDLNQILIKIKKGRLLPFGLFKLLFQRKKINALRIIALGVLEDYRKMGIEACFYGQIIKSYREKNFKMAEASWVLENNELMNRALLQINGVPYKRYRIFEKSL